MQPRRQGRAAAGDVACSLLQLGCNLPPLLPLHIWPNNHGQVAGSPRDAYTRQSSVRIKFCTNRAQVSWPKWKRNTFGRLEAQPTAQRPPPHQCNKVR